MRKDTINKVVDIFKKHQGFLRTSQAIEAGIAPKTWYALERAGIISRESRGFYRLTDLPITENFDLIHVAQRIPKGVICLISALAHYRLTTQIPHQVYLALPLDAEKPRLEYPPLRLFWLNHKSFSIGIEILELSGVPVQMYNPEKTLADCFKFRHKIGMDVVIEALKLYRETYPYRVDRLLEYAHIDRVTKVMRPYLEAMA